MSVSDWIELFGIIISMAVGIVSIIISCNSLKQNSIMIEEATKPYITIYGKMVYLGVAKYVLIIKNFGASSGTITSFSCNQALQKTALFKYKNPFEHIVGTTLAPSQSVCCEFNLETIKNEQVEPLVFEVAYKGVKEYPKDTIIVNVIAETENLIGHTHSPQNDNKTISTEDCMKSLVEEIRIISDAVNGIGELML